MLCNRPCNAEYFDFVNWLCYRHVIFSRFDNKITENRSRVSRIVYGKEIQISSKFFIHVLFNILTRQYYVYGAFEIHYKFVQLSLHNEIWKTLEGEGFSLSHEKKYALKEKSFWNSKCSGKICRVNR